jgi:hypothetical protein
MNSVLYMRILGDAIYSHGRRGIKISDADLYFRTWSLLRSYPDHEVKLHQKPYYAVATAMVPWTGFDDAIFFMEDLFDPAFKKKDVNAERAAFGQFWAELNHWPLIILAAENYMQFRTDVRDDEEAKSDYRTAYRLHLAGVEDAVLLAALQEPGLLSQHGSGIEAMPSEYAGAYLGLAV